MLLPLSPSSDLSIFSGSILDLFLSLKCSSQNDVHYSCISKNLYSKNLFNIPFCRSSRFPVRWSKTCISEESRSILPEAILHQSYIVSNLISLLKNFKKRLLSSSHTYHFYWLWSTWSQSWFWIFNVHLEQEKRIPLSELFGSNKGFN